MNSTKQQFARHFSKFSAYRRPNFHSIHRFVIAGTMSLVALALPAMAQHSGGGSGGRSGSSGGSTGPTGSPVTGAPSNPGMDPGPAYMPMDPNASTPGAINPIFATAVIVSTPDTSGLISAEACNSWTESSVRSPTVSATRLEIPSKASSEYQKACGSYKDRKYSNAEEHVRKAIDIYPNYSSAWVLLGQLLDAQEKRDDAEKACQKAVNIDPTYVAPYLCLAEFAADNNDWNELSLMSERALALDPVNNPYALYYASDSELHQHNLPQAEQKAQAAVQLDPWHHLPQAHLLLAHIYAAKGDLSSEASQLRLYLKSASNSPDAAQVKSDLAKLQAHQAAVAAATGPEKSPGQKPETPAAESASSKAESGEQADDSLRPTLKNNPAATDVPPPDSQVH